MQKILEKLKLESLVKRFQEHQDKTPLRALKYLALGIGALSLARTAFSIASHAWYHILAPQVDLAKRYGPKSYVLITGGSEGLGKEIGLRFAARGFNLILVARTKAKLDQAKAEIIDLYNVDVQLVTFDFSTSDPTKYNELEQSLQAYDISVVINNVGVFGTTLIQDTTPQEIHTMLYTNIFASTLTTRAFLPRLKARNGRSALLFIGSEAGDYPRSIFSVYASTKAYGNHLARGLEIELRKTNVDVILFAPGPTWTPMLSVHAPGHKDTFDGMLFLCQPKDVAEAFVRKIPRQKFIMGTFRHGFMHYVIKNHRRTYEWLKGE